MAGRLVSLSAGTVLGAAWDEAIIAAAGAGFGGVGLRWDGPDRPLPASGVRTRLADSGLALLDLEVVRLGPGVPVTAHRPWADLAAELGARFLLTVSGHADADRTRDELAELAGWCAPAGVTVALEFVRFTAVPTFAAASAIVAATGAANLAVLVDALHLQRGGETPADVAGAGRAAVGYLQLCDAPAGPPAGDPADLDALAHEARHGRLFPGDGELPLSALLAAVPEGLPCAVEVQSDRFAALEVAERVRRAMASVRRVLAAAGTSRGAEEEER